MAKNFKKWNDFLDLLERIEQTPAVKDILTYAGILGSSALLLFFIHLRTMNLSGYKLPQISQDDIIQFPSEKELKKRQAK